MRDLVTENEIVSCSIGFYDIVTNSFLIVQPILDASDIDDDWFVMVVSYEDDIRSNEIYKILYEFSAQDLGDALGLHARTIGGKPCKIS